MWFQILKHAKFAKIYMKNDQEVIVSPASFPAHHIARLLDISLQTPDDVQVVCDEPSSGGFRPGHHCHETWELFGVLAGTFRFDCLGREPAHFGAGTLVLVPPGCMHLSINEVPQDTQLRILVFNLPGDENPHGMFHAGKVGCGNRFSLDRERLSHWEKSLGMSVHQFVKLAAVELAGGAWGATCALARLRLLFATYVNLATDGRQGERSGTEAHVANAMSLLQSRYYDRNLSVERVAETVGVSTSHLNRIFRQVTGKSLYQVLVDIRLHRAASLLGGDTYLVKEVAEMTGWSSQLYFSAAFRRRYGCPPTTFRKRRRTQTS